jgi:hypothetical protein
LTFKNLNGDSVIFPSGVRKTEINEFHKYDYETAKVDHNGCQGDYFDADYNWMIKNTNVSNSRLDIHLNFLYTLSNPTTERELWLYFWFDTISPIYCFWGYYRFKFDTLYNEPYKGDSIVSYKPLITIGPKTFNNVYELFCVNPDDRQQEWISIAYYSINQGLVGFKSHFGKTWYLDKISK